MPDQSISQVRTPNRPRRSKGTGPPPTASPDAGCSARPVPPGSSSGRPAGPWDMRRRPRVPPLASVGDSQVLFHVKHQPGITQPLHARGHLIAFDLAPGAGRKEAAALLRRWSDTARRLMAGEPSAQDDTGWPTTPAPPP
ncbi:hypothetical protein SHKM778_92950 [Streptomyces sp. KM77-8]|uniref:Dyp-type peroxidase N-terminal domain-containing protein n=1 Tax=Streptomyces haneummycinicus TaxID=3074435 RepID=A0AAT9I044_9ACTN